LLVLLIVITVGGLLYLGHRQMILTAIFGSDPPQDR
jgi:hypothetical protein